MLYYAWYMSSQTTAWKKFDEDRVAGWVVFAKINEQQG